MLCGNSSVILRADPDPEALSPVHRALLQNPDAAGSPAGRRRRPQRVRHRPALRCQKGNASPDPRAGAVRPAVIPALPVVAAALMRPHGSSKAGRAPGIAGLALRPDAPLRRIARRSSVWRDLAAP